MPVKPRSRLGPSSHTRGCASLDRHILAYRQYLADRGNAAGYACSCEAAVVHLTMWMKGTKKKLIDLDERLVAEFVDKHLPDCHCATSARHPSSVRAALGHLLAVLRAAGAIAPRPLDMTEVGQELRRYDQYMEQVRGLAPNTRDGALRLVEALLRLHFGNEAIRFEVITPERVRRFFAAQAKNYKTPTSLGAVVSALRGYFRWRATLGDRTHALVGALAYPANWQLASLPKSLEPAEVEQLEAGRLFGKRISLHQVDKVFAQLRSDLGWINRGTHHAARIHDLRHTFVVRRILLWQQHGVDVDKAMLALSTYVGHAMVTNTYWYLQAVPELMAVAAKRFEACMPEFSHA